MTTENKKSEFELLKEEILRRAKEKNACSTGYGRALRSETEEELFSTIKDYFNWCCINIFDDAFINGSYKELFNKNGISCNTSIETGYGFFDIGSDYVLSGNSTSFVRGNATIQTVRGNATIQTVRENATIQDVYENATIQTVRGNATIQTVRENATIQTVRGNATIQDVYENATIQTVRGNATIQDVYGNATIQDVYGNAYVTSYSIFELKISENAIYRVRETNTIYYASESELEFVKQERND